MCARPRYFPSPLSTDRSFLISSIAPSSPSISPPAMPPSPSLPRSSSRGCLPSFPPSLDGCRHAAARGSVCGGAGIRVQRQHDASLAPSSFPSRDSGDGARPRMATTPSSGELHGVEPVWDLDRGARRLAGVGAPRVGAGARGESEVAGQRWELEVGGLWLRPAGR